MINAIYTALSGMHAAQNRVAASASNIANMTTNGALKPADGPAPYTPVTTTQSAVTSANGEPGGAQSHVVPTNRPFVPAYAPDSPFADQEGLIGTPNVDLAEEAVNLQIASHTYKANAQTIKIASEMQESLLGMFDRKA